MAIISLNSLLGYLVSIVLSLAFIFYEASLNPSATVLVPRYQLGKLLGLLVTYKNIGYFVAFLCLYLLPLNYSEQNMVQIMFCVLALLTVILLLFFNKRETKTLLINIKKEKEKKELQENYTPSEDQPLLLQNE